MSAPMSPASAPGGLTGPELSELTQEDRCAALNAQGEPCQMPPLRDSIYCWAHAPEKAPERQEARRKGGQARLQSLDNQGPRPCVSLRSVADVLSLLEEGAADALAMQQGERRARALAYLSTAALKALEVGDLEERLAALEERLRGVPLSLAAQPWRNQWPT